MTIQEARNTRTLIKEAELVHGSKDYVYNFYSNYTKSNDKIDVEDLDEETEGKLLDKNDPFIDITLAQFCFYNTTLKRLFSKSFSDDNLTLRLACLSNKMVGKRSWGSCDLPQALFDSEDNKEILAWFGIITSQELDVLFRNETINDNFLTELLELDNDLWMALSETNKLQVIRSLYYNERVCKAYDGPMDGYAEYTHGKLFSVIWDLAKKLPVEKKWAYALGNLLDKTSDDRYEFDSLEVAKRWNVEEEEDTTKKQFLDYFELVRYAIYKNVVKNLYGKDKTNKLHYQHEDLAYRACAYVQTDMTEDDIREAYAKDKLVAIEFIMRNMRVWRNDDLRDVLKDICWDADGTINDNYLDCANMYNWKEEELSKKYPDWFADKIEVEVDEDDKLLNVGLFRELTKESQGDTVTIIYEFLESDFKKQGKVLGWIFYGVIALVLIVLIK
jgi:hypothetical protein